MQNTVTSFPPITSPTATTLILGSIPGIASLGANQYYAHPRNAFWPIMADLYGLDVTLPYQARTERLKAANVALWDVLQQCDRQGSLDSAIKTGSRIPNDFVGFLKQHPHIRLIAFNGAEAEASFKRYVKTKLNAEGVNLENIHLVKLPSTSPAHTLAMAEKKAAWRAALI